MPIKLHLILVTMGPKKRANGVDNGKKKRAKKNVKDSDESESDFDDRGSHHSLENEDQNTVTTPVLEGDKITGTVVICGGVNWDMTGRKQPPKGVKPSAARNLWGPHRMGGLDNLKIRTIVSGSLACHSVVITTEGKAYVFGRNESGQLGVGDTVRRDVPTFVSSLDGLNVVSAACGKSHTLFLTDLGRVYACGLNTNGQLGLGTQSQSVNIPALIQYRGPPIKKIGCGGDFSAIVDINGNLYTFGSPEYGQLGHNTDGKFFVTSSKLAFACETKPRRVMVFIDKARDGQITPITDVVITDVACGLNHIVVMDTKERVFTWGFGAYGRLGHGDNKDEMVPRLLKVFESQNRGATMIAAGSTYSLAVNRVGVLLLWGQTKNTGEAAMYPKPVNDLTGWTVKCIGPCYKSIVLLADDSVVSWGSHPTYGELGYGESKPKSSSVPEEVKTLDKVTVLSVVGGCGHSMFLVKDDTEEDKANIKALPLFTPQGQ